jgi:predicted amidohydrolase YtcJ
MKSMLRSGLFEIEQESIAPIPAEARHGRSLATALAAHTTGAARANRLDAGRGAIRVGMAADVVVLDADPHAVEATALSGIGVELTLAEGRAVYSRVHDGALPTLLAQ